MLQDGAGCLCVQHGLGSEVQAALAIQPAFEDGGVELRPSDQAHGSISSGEAFVPEVYSGVATEDEKSGVSEDLREVADQAADFTLGAVLLKRLADDNILHTPRADHLHDLQSRLLPVLPSLNGTKRNGVHAPERKGQARELRAKVHTQGAAPVHNGLRSPIPQWRQRLWATVLDAQGVACVIRPTLVAAGRASFPALLILHLYEGAICIRLHRRAPGPDLRRRPPSQC
mmetsp:Transcript_50642/g.114909  ORF Transcript_50642/g.114909 Transcript_50642/m.114909 type:complete len:229 (+) Transcript_50642:514-1200(+)